MLLIKMTTKIYPFNYMHLSYRIIFLKKMWQTTCTYVDKLTKAILWVMGKAFKVYIFNPTQKLGSCFFTLQLQNTISSWLENDY